MVLSLRPAPSFQAATAFTSGSIVAPPPPAPPAQLVSVLATTNSSLSSPGGPTPTSVFLGFWSNGGPVILGLCGIGNLLRVR